MIDCVYQHAQVKDKKKKLFGSTELTQLDKLQKEFKVIQEMNMTEAKNAIKRQE